MNNIVLLGACFVIGMLLRRSGRLPSNAHASLNAVSIYTHANYALAHKKGFEEFLSKVKPKAGKHESARHGKRGVYYVAFGEPARKCAIGAIQSFKKYLPDIEVALASDTPLGIEDVFIETADTDIGGREAKVKIYDLAPKDWQYVAYLDADTEITAGETFLWNLLEDGWDMSSRKTLTGSQLQRT